ncbi:helix-turn-helix domain-containing protein [Olivibacter domesticus]|uniref:Helix-turn-helix domain-containing protein n=1 Tax=Olivibacter domesticus TaxID=407022 RepID=A0A1H7LXL3_OLID1|nr:helix-turn-helix transcriptional regulator [Olivibacter domesticus]SEL03674.1 Helix-turn-helix domain-containing protein [Olivibacter domesticus]
MNMEVYAPSASLSPYIKTYLFLDAQNELLNRILPDTSLVMAFRYKGHVSYQTAHGQIALPSSAISGLRKSFRLINYAPDTSNLLVIFKEASAKMFIREPLHELFDDSISLTDLTGYQNLTAFEEQLTFADTNRQRINLLEKFLLSKLIFSKPYELIFTALQRIHTAKGVLRIKELAASLFISQDAFEKRFRRMVGTSPKQYCYIVRMKASVDDGLKRSLLSESAFNAGYFDQAHFNKDFKLFTGQTPTDFLSSPVFW